MTRLVFSMNDSHKTRGIKMSKKDDINLICYSDGNIYAIHGGFPIKINK